MIYKKDRWIEYVKKAVADLKAPPSSGKVCAVASLRFIRDSLIDDVTGGKPVAELEDDADKAFVESVSDSLNELIKAVNKDGACEGFASNASAAAKAAGFTGTAPMIVEIES